MTTILYTIGHGDQPGEALIDRLLTTGVRTLVDIRSHPRSRRNPQFDEEPLRLSAEQAGMVYHWAGRQLGGLRKGQADSIHPALDEGLRGFADYMASPGFGRAAAQIRRLADREPLVLLCAEADPLFCHRSLVADYLTLEGVEVRHLLWPDGEALHHLRPEARRESAALVYDRTSISE